MATRPWSLTDLGEKMPRKTRTKRVQTISRDEGFLKVSPSGSFDLLAFLLNSTFVNIIVPLNLLLFVLCWYTERGAGLMPRLILSPENLAKGYIWTFITSGFIHADWQHLLLNMLGVFVFGRVVEQELGGAKTFFIYFGALLLSMLLATAGYHFIFHKNVIIIGASGALMGLISASMLLAPFRITMEMLLPIPVMVKGWLFFFMDLQGLLQQEKDGVSHLSHLLGFLTISILVYFLSKKDRKRFKSGLWINIISFVAFIALSYCYKKFFAV